jgi:signal transduction histidine kinase
MNGGVWTSRRTVAALVLTLIAVLVPSSAWYIAGRRQIKHSSNLEVSSAYQKGYKQAVRVAERMATRLELLRETESRRPFYHYQNLYHDPKGAAEGASVAISPLAQGSADPLVEVYFQIDDQARLTMPSLNEEFPDLSSDNGDTEQCSQLWRLRDVAMYFEADMPHMTVAAPGPWPSFDAGDHTEKLGLKAWRQHVRANDVYSALKYPHRAAGASPLLPAGVPDSEVKVVVGPLRWHTLSVSGKPALVALRSLQTPAGSWVQGFMVDLPTAGTLVDNNSDFTARFEPKQGAAGDSPPKGQPWVAAEVEGTDWQVAIDVSRSLAAASAKTLADKARFLRSFGLGSLAAGLAGALLLWLVVQSEKLAQQRIRFAASAAHELRTPLAGLRLYGEMLAEGLGDPGRAREYARRMAGEAERLGRVVTNVLSFTKLERGALHVHMATGDLAEAVRDAYSRQQPALEQAGAPVELDLPENLPKVQFDRDAIAHIVQNLLDNAEKYTRDREDRQIRLRIVDRGASLDLEVADNGKGVAPALKRRLFEPFVRGNEEDGPEGLGLGLVLVKTLVEAQNASIQHLDAPGGGALFRVSFPTG